MSQMLVPYDEYKNSGVEWLGIVPKEWGIVRLKWSVDIQKNGVWGDDPNGDNNDIICVRVADFDRTKQSVRVDNLTVRNIAVSDRVERTLSKGDLLLEKSGGGELWPVGFVVKFDHDFPAVCSNFVARVKVATNWSSDYLKYVHLWLYQRKITTRTINQTSGIQNLDAQSYLNTLTVLPPLADQQAISDYLDKQTSRIDALVREQEELMILLKEKRQALISHAVTKGLNPSAKMKPSGVEWIGEIPEGWTLPRLAHLATVENGSTPSRDDPSLWSTEEDGIPWLTSGDVNQHVVNTCSQWVSPKGLDSSPIRLLPIGSLIVGMIGEGRTRGTSARLAISATINQNIAGVVPSGVIESEFLHFVFQASYEALRNLGRGGNQSALNCEILSSFRIPLPNIQEQNAIAAFLSSETSKIDVLISEAESSIVLMQEHRSTLVSAVVTGKVRVPV